MPRGKSIYQYPHLYPADAVAAARKEFPEKFAKHENKSPGDSKPPEDKHPKGDSSTPPEGPTSPTVDESKKPDSASPPGKQSFIALTNFTTVGGFNYKRGETYPNPKDTIRDHTLKWLLDQNFIKTVVVN